MKFHHVKVESNQFAFFLGLENSGSQSKKPKINIICDVTICNPQKISPKSGQFEDPNEVVVNLLNNIIKNVVETSEKNQLTYYTKEGKVRKRKKYHTSLQERKKQKTDETIAKHGVQETCRENCTKKCSQTIDISRQSAINKEFWELTYEEQRQFIFSSAKKIIKKRKTKDGDSRRNNTFVYYLKSDTGTDVQVCKKFFLAILGYQANNDRIIRDVLEKTDPKRLLVKSIKRGHPSEKKIDRSHIIDHINSFGPTISHYRREHAPNRKYLPSDINIKLMHVDFLKKYPNIHISYELYRQQVAEMNISFAVLGHEECWQCETFDLHFKNTKHGKKNLDPQCADCQKWEIHHKDAIEARNEYKTDASITTASPESLYFSADLQKVSHFLC